MYETSPKFNMELVLCLLAVLAVASFSSCQDHGVQMRLTEKGMAYTVDIGIGVMKKDLQKTSINRHGTAKGLRYSLENLKITKLDFGSYVLTPVQGTGMKGVVSGINIDANGQLKIEYSIFSDETALRMKATGIDFEMTIQIGADAHGRATINVTDCSGSVDKIDLDFSGGMSFIYNLASPYIEAELKETFEMLLCTIATEEINTKAKEELATFPVVKQIDDYAEIDYRLTSPPQFTDEYMDAFLKGEFKEVKNGKIKALTIPSFPTSSDHKKMVYFWVTDYTINSAGLVYHKAGKLRVKVNAWDDEVPEDIKSMLQTNKFAILFPKILIYYANQPMGVTVKSYKPPTAKITTDEIHFKLYVFATFSVKSAELFTLKFDITAGADIGVRKTNITADIKEFNYEGSVIKSVVGGTTISLNNVLVRGLLDVLVIKTGNGYLQTGFPLPKVSEVTFRDFNVKLIKDAIRVGTDLEYVEKKH